MAAVGWLVLTGLTALAFVDAVGVARRAGPASRAELAIATTMAFTALITAPVLTLGYLGRLTAFRLGVLSLLLFSGVFFALARGRGLRAHLRACEKDAASLARIPLDALVAAFRARSVVFLGLAGAAALVGVAFVLTYLIGFASWDGFFYHDPIVGYAIQDHGFAIVPLPPNYCVQATNSYPRLVESVSIWFCIFADRTFIEIPNVLFSAPLMIAVYALTRRFGDRVASMGWGVVVFLVPHVWHGLCSTYIDLPVGFFMVAGMYYASRPEFRVRDGVMATLAMALVVAAKGSGPIWVPPIAIIACVRLVYHHGRARKLAVAGTILGGALALAGLAALTFVRNWVAFANPMWPVTYANPKYGVAWKGLVTMGQLVADPPIKDLVDVYYDTPRGGMDDMIHRGYGLAVVWIVVPLGIVALLLSVVPAVLQLLRAVPRGDALGMWLAAIPGLVALKTSPSLDQPRYNIHLVTAFVVACAWLVRRPKAARLREGVVAAAVVLAVLPFFWLKDAYPATKEEMGERLSHPFAPRAYSNHPSFDLLQKQRYEEVHAGDKVAYTEDLAFVGAAWNFDFSNRVDYVPWETKEQFLARIDAYGPTWIAVGGGSAARAALEATGKWEAVGQITPPHDTVMMRRKR
jgi:hypothetical protein